VKSYREIQDESSQTARHELKKGLMLCTEKQQHFFKRLYAGGDLTLSIEAVITLMPEAKLECAMDQVQRTIDKNRAGEDECTTEQ